MEIKITKRKQIYEIKNDMCWNFYWLYNGRIISDDGKCFRRFKFVVSFDIFDVMEFYDEDMNTPVSKSDMKNYADELAFSMTSYIKSFDDYQDFYDICKNSIEKYNNLFKYNI